MRVLVWRGSHTKRSVLCLWRQLSHPPPPPLSPPLQAFSKGTTTPSRLLSTPVPLLLILPPPPQPHSLPASAASTYPPTPRHAAPTANVSSLLSLCRYMKRQTISKFPSPFCLFPSSPTPLAWLSSSLFVSVPPFTVAQHSRAKTCSNKTWPLSPLADN